MSFDGKVRITSKTRRCADASTADGLGRETLQQDTRFILLAGSSFVIAGGSGRTTDQADQNENSFEFDAPGRSRKVSFTDECNQRSTTSTRICSDHGTPSYLDDSPTDHTVWVDESAEWPRERLRAHEVTSTPSTSPFDDEPAALVGIASMNTVIEVDEGPASPRCCRPRAKPRKYPTAIALVAHAAGGKS